MQNVAQSTSLGERFLGPLIVGLAVILRAPVMFGGVLLSLGMICGGMTLWGPFMLWHQGHLSLLGMWSIYAGIVAVFALAALFEAVDTFGEILNWSLGFYVAVCLVLAVIAGFSLA